MWRRCPHLEPRPRSKLTPARPWFSCLSTPDRRGPFQADTGSTVGIQRVPQPLRLDRKERCARAACELGRRDDNRYRSFLPPQILRRPKMDRVFAEPNNWHRSQPYAGNTCQEAPTRASNDDQVRKWLLSVHFGPSRPACRCLFLREKLTFRHPAWTSRFDHFSDAA